VMVSNRALCLLPGGNKQGNWPCENRALLTSGIHVRESNLTTMGYEAPTPQDGRTEGNR